MRHGWLIAGIMAGILCLPRYADAQYTTNFQTNIISGVTSNWAGSYVVGSTNFAVVLLIQNSGVLSNGNGTVAAGPSSSNNNVVVSGFGSVWNNSGALSFGNEGPGNSLVISNGGQVIDSSGTLGFLFQGSNNIVHVTDGAVWQNITLVIGNIGSSNSVVVAGGSVLATNVLVGANSGFCNNLLKLDSGSVIVTNASTNAVLEVRRGVFILNGGTLQVDRFVMTNACAQFIRTGGTLIYGVAVLNSNRDDDGDGIPNGWEQAHGLDPLNAADANLDTDGDGMSNLQEYLSGTDPTNSASAFRISSVAREGQDLRVTWQTGTGKTNALQSASGGGYNTNGFADIFIVTNTTVSVTNYLDVGAATNSSSQFYRVRLVP
jgi:T5SS/PEP-CTERM-associated repeat protein